jgi:hypothetical protein
MAKKAKARKTQKGARSKLSLAPRSDCCPIIKLKCKMTKPRTEWFSWRDPYSGEMKQSKATLPPRRVCAVELGSKQVTGYTAQVNKLGRKINQYRRALAARNCNVKVDISQSLKGKKPEPPTTSDVKVTGDTPPPAVAKKLRGKALRAFNEFLRNMY